MYNDFKLYKYAINDGIIESFVEATASFFRSYGGFRGEAYWLAKNGPQIENWRKYVYYSFQIIITLFFLAVTFFHFGKECYNELQRKYVIFRVTKIEIKNKIKKILAEIYRVFVKGDL